MPVSNFVSVLFSRSSSSSTSWNQAPGASSGAISMMVTRLPVSFRISAVSSPVRPEPATTTFLSRRTFSRWMI